MIQRTVVLALCLAPVACTGPTGMALMAAHAEQGIAQARELGAYRCAGIDLANAEAHLAFMRLALARADLTGADYHGRVAMLSSDRAAATTKNNPCCHGAGPDRDGDGIPDAQDQCPDEPEDKDGFQDADGCPDPDNDGDTVLDTQDQCPNEPGEVANLGCPLLDRDHDGIPDAQDHCPDVPEDINGFQDTDGCPDGDSLDSDHDGIDNAHDKCPMDPEDKDGFQDEDGCPDPDNDMDGVPDVSDLCPNQPGPVALKGCPAQDRDSDDINDDVDQCPDVAGPPPHGCPRKVLVSVSADHIDIKQQINFVSGKATINKRDLSLEILNQVASVMQANPGFKIIIEGHTDGNGPAARNLVLSDNRAQAVRNALIERGVDGARLEAVGFGESKPIAPNRTAKGRAKNRRVVFTIVSNTPPTPAAVPPPPPPAPAAPTAPPPAPAAPGAPAPAPAPTTVPLAPIPPAPLPPASAPAPVTPTPPPAAPEAPPPPPPPPGAPPAPAPTGPTTTAPTPPNAPPAPTPLAPPPPPPAPPAPPPPAGP